MIPNTDNRNCWWVRRGSFQGGEKKLVKRIEKLILLAGIFKLENNSRQLWKLFKHMFSLMLLLRKASNNPELYFYFSSHRRWGTADTLCGYTDTSSLQACGLEK